MNGPDAVPSVPTIPLPPNVLIRTDPAQHTTTEATMLDRVDAPAAANHRPAASTALAVPSTLDPDPDAARVKIRLPVVTETELQLARALAVHLEEDLRDAGALAASSTQRKGHAMVREITGNSRDAVRKRYLAQWVADEKTRTSVRIGIGAQSSTYDEFVATVRAVAAHRGVPAPEAITPDLIALVAHASVRERKTFVRFPNGMFHGTLEELQPRVGVLVRLAVGASMQTARDVEKHPKLSDVIQDAGLAVLADTLGVVGCLECGYPGSTSTDDPPIRPWRIQYNNKWTGVPGRELAKRGMKWALTVGRPIFDAEAKQFDLEAIRTTKWSQVLDSFGLRKMLELCAATPTTVEAIALGAEALGVPSPIGIEPGMLPPWRVPRSNVWPKVGPRRLIDDVTEFVVRRIAPERNPKLFGPDRNLIPEEVAKCTSWGAWYQEAASDGLRNSGLNIPQALARVYPEVFGYRSNQIPRWSMRYEPMWNGEDGVRTFREAMAVALGRSGLGTLDLDRLTYTFSVSQFLAWYESTIVGYHGSVSSFFTANKLSGALKLSPAEGRAGDAFRLLVGLQVVPAAERASAPRPEYPPFVIPKLLGGKEATFEMTLRPTSAWARRDEALAAEAELAERMSRAPSLDDGTDPLTYDASLPVHRLRTAYSNPDPKIRRVFDLLEGFEVPLASDPLDHLRFARRQILERKTGRPFTEDSLREVLEAVRDSLITVISVPEPTAVRARADIDAVIYADAARTVLRESPSRVLEQAAELRAESSVSDARSRLYEPVEFIGNGIHFLNVARRFNNG